MKPLEVEIVVAELAGTTTQQLYHIAYDGTVTDEERFSVLGGEAESDLRAHRRTVAGRTGTWRRRSRRRTAALAGPDRTPGRRRPRGGRS